METKQGTSNSSSNGQNIINTELMHIGDHNKLRKKWNKTDAQGVIRFLAGKGKTLTIE